MYANGGARIGSVILLAVACSRPTPVSSDADASVERPPAPTPRTARSNGQLEIWFDGLEVGYERSTDDGNAVTSRIYMGDGRSAVVVRRDPRQIDADEGKWTSNLADGVFPAWPGGSAFGRRYALAAEWFPDADHLKIKLIGPPKWEPHDGEVTVTSDGQDGKRVELVAPWGKLVATVDGRGTVTGWESAREDGKIEGRAAPEGIDEEFIEIASGEVAIRGSLWLPRGAKAVTPIVLLVAGSGPTDRDFNGPIGHLRTNAARFLAEALAKQGISSLRFDKRGVGQSGRNFDASTSTVLDGADDVSRLIERIRSDKRFGKLTLAGHSEGGLVAVLAAQKTAPDALIFVNSMGRDMITILREQLSRKLGPTEMAEFERIIRALRAKKPVGEIPAYFALIFPKSALEYIRSELDLDVGDLLAKLTTPALVLQGETDIQTSPLDAKQVARKRPDVKVQILPSTNHVLKEAKAREGQEGTYGDPTLPLAPGFAEAFLSGVKR